jgi:hypothetical protein
MEMRGSKEKRMKLLTFKVDSEGGHENIIIPF